MPKILIIDDSLFMRTLVADCLGCDPTMEVHTVRSGAEALKILPKLRPDCITLDLVMPGEDGLTTLAAIMARFPTPVIILSAYSQEGADITLQCLAAGAVGFVAKPSGEISLDIDKVKERLLAEVKAATEIARKKIDAAIFPLHVKGKRVDLPMACQITVIGASTGGPQTIEGILAGLPKDFPHAILVAQHMPNLFFTNGFVHRLDRYCPLPVKVAKEGELIRGGMVYLAPSGFVTTLLRPEAKSGKRHLFVHLTREAANGLTPSIDAVMTSVAAVCGKGAVGILLTGLGSDGLKGMGAIKANGGKTIAQDESAMIWGMPRVVIEAGLADQILPAAKIIEEIIQSGRLTQNNPGENLDEDKKKQATRPSGQSSE